MSVARTGSSAVALAAAVYALACSKSKESAPQSATEPTRATAAATATATAGSKSEDNVCTWLSAEDFAAAGLNQGKAKRENGFSGPGCTWDPVLGNGGFLHVEVTSTSAYDKRKERSSKGGTVTPLSGFGDEAFLIKALAGQLLYVKKGDKAVRIDGNAQLDQKKLEPLARAVLKHL